MDDFSMYGITFDHCLSNLAKVFKRCEDTNLFLNWGKCHFMAQEGVILGHIVSNKGIEVDKAKVEVIEKLPPPTSVKGVRSFFRHVSFYQRFIKDFLKIVKPLIHLLIKYVPFDYNEECLSAFLRLKVALTTAPVMQAPNLRASF